MSIQDDVISALAGVALDEVGVAKVFPEAAPEDVELPLVIVKRNAYAPEMTLGGPAGIAKSSFVFECWAKTKAEAIDLAAAVGAAIEAAAGLIYKFRETATGEDYQSETDEYVEPIYYSFWHDE